MLYKIDFQYQLNTGKSLKILIKHQLVLFKHELICL